MVSLVIVSHCHQLANGVKELADQMANGQIDIAAVGGIVIENRPPTLGTDAVRISQAVESVWTPSGVLLLVDLGSAILSTKLALDMLPDKMHETCLISNAPSGRRGRDRCIGSKHQPYARRRQRGGRGRQPIRKGHTLGHVTAVYCRDHYHTPTGLAPAQE